MEATNKFRWLKIQEDGSVLTRGLTCWRLLEHRIDLALPGGEVLGADVVREALFGDVDGGKAFDIEYRIREHDEHPRYRTIDLRLVSREGGGIWEKPSWLLAWDWVMGYAFVSKHGIEYLMPARRPRWMDSAILSFWEFALRRDRLIVKFLEKSR